MKVAGEFYFTKDGERYCVIKTPWTGVWVVGEYGRAFRSLPAQERFR